MFGLVISGRPLNAQPTQMNDTQLSFSIPAAPSFSHITLFLLPGATLPPDAGATVWIQLPSSPEFKLLGALSMQKQSAIFKISGVVSGTTVGGTVGNDDEMVDEDTAAAAAPADPTQLITLGISLEPAATVEAQLATLLQPSNPHSALVRQPPPPVPGVPGGSSNTTSSNPVSTKVLAQRIIGNAFNFLSSFGDGQTVPIKAFQDWWNKFEKKIELDPTFLERAEQG